MKQSETTGYLLQVYLVTLVKGLNTPGKNSYNYITHTLLSSIFPLILILTKKYNIICILRRETKVPGVTWHRNHFNCAMVGDRPEKTTTYQTHPRSLLTCYTYEQRPLANIQ